VIAAWFRRPLVLTALGLIVLAAVLGGVAFVFRDNLSRYTMKPSREFDAASAPKAPDYAQADAWARLPAGPLRGADAFVVYPLIYFGGNRWNARVDDREDQERLKDDILPLVAGPFAENTNLFVPRYRQANAYAFMTTAPSAQNARRLAYQDVAAAFQNFLSQRNQNRPFVIVAQGQGALHAIRLLREHVAKDDAVRARFVAAYLSEVALPADAFDSYLAPLRPCAEAISLGCINVWHTTTQGARFDLPRTSAPVWTEEGGFESTRGRALACVNPLTWNFDGRAADAAMNFGAAGIDSRAPNGVSLTPGTSGADCWNGLLFVDAQPDPLFSFAGPRYRDLFPPVVNLFYENIRQNVALRLEAYRQASAPPSMDGSTQQSPDPIE
jgi:hypothetical protein